MDKLAAKLISLGSLLVLTLIFSVVPYFLVLRGSRSLVSDRRRNKIIALLNCFGGGVFLSTLLLHLMTEGADEFEVYKSKAGWTNEYPLFNIFVASGFFLVAFIEFFMHSHLHHKKPINVQIRPESDLSHEQDNVFDSQYGAVDVHKREGRSSSLRAALIQKDGSQCMDEHGESEGLLQGRHSRNVHSFVDEKADYITIEHAAGGSSSHHRILQQRQDHQNCEHTSRETNSLSHSESDSGMPSIITELPPDGLRALLLLVALSFHTVFDGLAVGLQDTVSGVWQVFTAISIHKCIIAFCLGLELFKSQPNTPWKAFAWICFFSLMSPVGIGLGIGLTSSGISELAKLLSSSVLQGVAAGTFLYVTFLEILNMYIGHNCDRKFLNIFFALIGFSAMAAVKILDSD